MTKKIEVKKTEKTDESSRKFINMGAKRQKEKFIILSTTTVKTCKQIRQKSKTYSFYYS